MNKNQINRKEMFHAVLSYMDTNVEKWSSIPKVGEFKNKLSTINDSLDAARKAQQEAKVFIGKSLKQLKYTISQKVDVVNDVVEAFAVVTENAELESRMAGSAWDLNRLRNEDFVVKIKEVISEAGNHKEILIPEYGLTQKQLDDVMADTDNYLQRRGLPRAYNISSTQATKDVEVLIKEGLTVLSTQLDKVMKLFKRRDPNFYTGYLAARVIVDD